MSKQYNKSPIVEALCEFQFIPTQPWDLTIPGMIYDKINKDFPHKQQQVGIGIQFKPTEKGGVEHKVESAPARLQFFNQDKTMLVQVGPDLFTVNQLKPYKAWSVFKPLILAQFKIYNSIAKPKGLKRIGLRYINRINIKAASVNLEDFINFYPQLPKDIPQVHSSFLTRIEIPYKNNRDHILVTVGSTIPEDTGISSIILDLDYALSQAEGVPLDETERWLEEAHSIIESVFESCITDVSRQIFEEVKK